MYLSLLWNNLPFRSISYPLTNLTYSQNSHLEGSVGKKHKPFALIEVSVIILLKGDLDILKQMENW